MAVAISVLAILLVALWLKKDNNPYMRAAAIALFGIHIFFIAPCLIFLADLIDLKPWGEQIILLASILICAGILLVAQTLIRTRPAVSTCLIIVFAITTISHFAFNKSIKRFIADAVGYFSSPPLTASSNPGNGNRFVDTNGGFQLTVPANWEKKIHGSGAEFFRYENADEHIEFRPTCFHNSSLTLPEIAQNIHLQSENKSSRYCYKMANDRACLIKTREGFTERWRWLFEKAENEQAIQLDFLFTNKTLDNQQQAMAVITSIEIQTMAKPLPWCIGLADWF